MMLCGCADDAGFEGPAGVGLGCLGVVAAAVAVADAVVGPAAGACAKADAGGASATQLEGPVLGGTTNAVAAGVAAGGGRSSVGIVAVAESAGGA